MGLRLPATPTESQEPAGGRLSRHRSDHLVRVEGYDLSQARVFGVNHEGALGLYEVSSASLRRARERPSSAPPMGRTAEYNGRIIDAPLAAHLPPGRWVVLSNARWTGISVGGVPLFEAEKVVNSTAQTPDKLFPGLFTVAAAGDRISSVQAWEGQAFSVGDMAARARFAEELDAAHWRAAEGLRFNKPGFQMRVLRPSESGSSWRCVESSFAYDCAPRSRRAGAAAAPPLPLTSALFGELCKSYLDKLFWRYPDWDSMAAQIDVMVFRNFKASIVSPGMSIGRPGGPLSRMACWTARINATNGATYTGRAGAVHGILEVTSDDEAGSNPRNLAQRLHANGKARDVREAVLSFDGKRVFLDSCLDARPVDNAGDGSAP
jgi:hypothetical protein